MTTPENQPDPEADATQNDALVEQTDNAPTEQDGPQEDVSQEPLGEDDVEEDPDDGGPTAP